MGKDFCITQAFVEQVNMNFHLLLQQIGGLSIKELRVLHRKSEVPKVAIYEYPDKAKCKVVWKFGNIMRYRHLTKQQIRNLIFPTYSIMIKVIKSFNSKGIEL